MAKLKYVCRSFDEILDGMEERSDELIETCDCCGTIRGSVLPCKCGLQKTPSSDTSRSDCSAVHRCYCGTGKPTPHNTGEGGCVRFMVAAPIPADDGMWIVDGHCVTDYTLRQQRGYHRHVDGCWSRWPGSVNSITA